MDTARTALLAVTSETPLPLDSGGHLRTFHLLRLLATRFDVRLVAPSNRATAAAQARELAAAGIGPRLVPVASRTLVGEAVKVAVAAARREPYVLFRRHLRRAVTARIYAEARQHSPGVLYLDHLDSLAYASTVSGVPVVVDMHNVYSRLARRAAAEATDALRRRYIVREADLIARMERRAVQVAHTILAVSDVEARYFSDLGATRVVVVPNGVDCAAYATRRARPAPPTILYVGSFSWPPNACAARFLACEVLPAVHQSLPSARLVIVGKNPPPDLVERSKADGRLEMVGHVKDVTSYFSTAHVMAVPLEAGGGTRLKILEAFAAGLPVVSTPVGCEGIAARDGEQLVVADRSAFAPAILQLLQSPERAHDMAERARRLARDKYDWNVVGRLACDAVAGAVRRTPAPEDRLADVPMPISVATP
jgi:glycosyltransferase involved in cell wall biosynthesis